jgi:hypothetical protein
MLSCLHIGSFEGVVIILCLDIGFCRGAFMLFCLHIGSFGGILIAFCLHIGSTEVNQQQQIRLTAGVSLPMLAPNFFPSWNR